MRFLKNLLLPGSCRSERDEPHRMRDIEECAQKTHLASALLNGEKIQNADES